MLLGYGYIRNNLVRLGGYPTHRNVANISFLFLFCVYIWSIGMTRLSRSRLSKRNEMNKNRYKHFSQPVNTKNMRMHLYKLQLIFTRGYGHRLYSYTKICYSTYWASPLSGYFFHINIQLVTICFSRTELQLEVEQLYTTCWVVVLWRRDWGHDPLRGVFLILHLPLC